MLTLYKATNKFTQHPLTSSLSTVPREQTGTVIGNEHCQLSLGLHFELLVKLLALDQRVCPRNQHYGVDVDLVGLTDSEGVGPKAELDGFLDPSLGAEFAVHR